MRRIGRITVTEVDQRIRLAVSSHREVSVSKKAAIGLIGTLIVSGVMSGCAAPQNQGSSGRFSAGSSQPSMSFDYNRHIGWVHGRCLAIKRTDLSAGMVVQVVALESPQRTMKTSVTSVATHDSGCLALLPDRGKINQKKGRSFYILDLPEGVNFLAVGVLDYEGELLPVADGVRMDLDRDGKQEAAGFCQTSEGMKFFLLPVDQSGAPPIWSDYYYLGYDTKPTCKPQ